MNDGANVCAAKTALRLVAPATAYNSLPTNDYATESVDIATTAFATAAKYNPFNGLITDNNFNQYKTGLTAGTFVNPYAPPPPSTNAAPPASSITGVGAYTPDWSSLINNDAGLAAVKSAVNANNAQNQDQLNSQVANAYEQFGSNIDLAALAKQLGMTEADLQNVLSPAVQQLAKENTDAGLSTQARLQQANDQAKQQTLAELNKRGLLHSGEAGYQLDHLNTGYRQAQFDAYQKFLGYLSQYQQGYLSALNANTGNLTNAISGAATRQAGLNQGSAGVTAIFDHTDANGRPVYKGPDGSFYNADGSPWTPPASTPPPAQGTTPDTYFIPSTGQTTPYRPAHGLAAV